MHCGIIRDTVIKVDCRHDCCIDFGDDRILVGGRGKQGSELSHSTRSGARLRALYGGRSDSLNDLAHDQTYDLPQTS